MRSVLTLAVLLAFTASATASAASNRPGTYRVTDVRTAFDRAAVAGSGAAIVAVDHGSVDVTASRSDLRKLHRAGYATQRLRPRGTARPAHARGPIAHAA